jgi:DNA invertase Pin-like site-specific DNA recombinase
MVAEFEANIGHLRTREGMAKARRQGKLRGKQPKLPPSAARAIRRRYADGEVSLADLAEEYSVGRSTIHRRVITSWSPPRTTFSATSSLGREDFAPLVMSR